MYVDHLFGRLARIRIGNVGLEDPYDFQFHHKPEVYMKQHPSISHLYITEDGLVFSTKSNKFLSVCKTKTGYLGFATRLFGRKSPCQFLRVHRLVADVYVNNPDNKPFVNHLDGNKENNHFSNLEWVSAKENVQHAYLLGLSCGKAKYDNAQCSVSPDIVDRAKQLRSMGWSFRAIAKELNTVHSRVQAWVTW